MMTKVKANLSRTALAIMPICADFNIPSRYRKITNGQQYLLANRVQPVDFPNARHIGCYFHYANSVYRQIQQLHLTTAYRDDQNVRNFIALPLTSVNLIERSF
ncbi:unnamed protein product [Adineta steineri]|uniref:Uncharacterized protein n=1 Tax=Adineta steineri TaxID=433720 RepID=A0A819M221_9BILA|nr:unnamed protein product [Adineta steineri]CAF3972515.1 unnamed protein product [Adineta steineri]